MTDRVYPLFIAPAGVQTRWASPENFTGDKGKGCTAYGGRKGSPLFPLPAGEARTLAQVSGASGIIRRL
jgi:hypothetical protein